jgi:RND superfamily putative drug exporter
MALMNRRAWWLPRWLDRILPPISIEGGDYFERRERELAGEPAGIPTA